MEVINIEIMMKAFNDYCVLKEDLEEAKEEIKEIEDNNRDIKYYLNVLEAVKFANKKSYGKYDDTIRELLLKHPDLEEYKNLKYYVGTYLNDIDSIETRNFCEPASQLVLLDVSSKKYLVDLKHITMDDVTNLKPELLEFIIKMLNARGYFIGNIKPSELPFLMAVKEDLEQDEDKNLYEQHYFMDESYGYQMAKEFEKAKIDDKKIGLGTNKTPFIFDSIEEKKKWDELDEMESSISKEEYLLRYYKLLLIFGNDVEELYNVTPEDEKKYVLDAYHYYSSEVLDDNISYDERKKHFRTLSNVINIEILKRKSLTKK